MTNRPGLPVPTISGRAGNFTIAIARFGQTWARGVPSVAARRFSRLWPVWTVGCLLVVLFAITLDVPSVPWARDLAAPIVEFFEWLTRFGKSGWLLVPTGIVSLVLLLSDWRFASRRISAAWTEFGILAGFAFLSIAGSGILVNVFKQLIGRARPRVFDEEGAFSFVPFQFDYSYAAFPSGHSTTMGALAVILAVIAPRLRAPALLVCGLVASSRVIVGEHYPSDVAAGFLLGAAYTWFFAVALAQVGIGFEVSPAGTIRARVAAIRGVFKRSNGISNVFAGLLSAILGGFSRTVSS